MQPDRIQLGAAALKESLTATLTNANHGIHRLIQTIFGMSALITAARPCG